ncbi:hypothetical protein GGR51DRAFT_61917 [Nemania sp. FL0031]|nr:hypothetical protein GGR51DRAFT_61917 [Nemania sp. FL0031]
MANETSIFYQNVWCVYPLSGTYTRLQRILFYISIVIAFTFRFHEWLSTVAMGGVFVYSFVAAVHAIPMSVQASLGADADIVALFSIVFTSLYCAIMARMYSPRFIGLNFNTFYNCWIFGSVTVVGFLSVGLNRFYNFISHYVVQQTCPNMTDCPSPCTSRQPKVLFRQDSGDTVAVVLDSWWQTVSDGTKPDPAVGVPSVPGHTNGFHTAITGGIVIQLIILYPLFILGQRNHHRPPRVARNDLFERLLSRRVMANSQSSTLERVAFHLVYYLYSTWKVIRFFVPEFEYPIRALWALGLIDIESVQTWIDDRSQFESVDSKERRKYARNIALVWYILCMLGYVSVPVMLLVLIFKFELDWFDRIPESEGPDAIGQWGPVVGLAASLGLAVVVRQISATPSENGYIEVAADDTDPFAFGGSQAGAEWYWKYRVIAALVKERNDFRSWWRNSTLPPIEPVPSVSATVARPGDSSGDGIQLLPAAVRPAQVDHQVDQAQEAQNSSNISA